MSAKSVFETIGGDVKKVFSFLGSPKGQAIIGAGEGLAETVDPALSGIFSIANNWLTEIFKAESLAAAAGQQDGTGPQKAAMVSQTMVPQVIEWLRSQGIVTNPTAADIGIANTALVTFLKALSGPTS